MAGRKKTAAMELAIGATIIAGIIVLIVMLMAWGNTSSLLGKHYRLVVNMKNVGGLKEGAPVKMGGFQIGRVATIQIRPGGTDMEIVLDIDENRILPKGSTAKVSTAGLVGDAFMEIVPGQSAEMIKRATTVADAERLDSSPLPDMSELMTKVNEFGDQLTILTTNLNDIIGDLQFRKALKSMAVNLDAVSYQANLILQRGQSVVDNVEVASINVAKLSDTLRENVEKVSYDVSTLTQKLSEDVGKLTDSALEIADKAKGTIDGVQDTVANINDGVTDARRAINSTIGNPRFAEDLTQTIYNINAVTASLSGRREAIDQMLGNIGGLSEDLRAVAQHVKGITGNIEPATVHTTLVSLNTAITSMTEVVEQIKREPVLALSLNKAADRIVKMKFDEMAKQPQFKTSDQVLDEINRWTRDSMQRGYLLDPEHSYGTRPYVMPERRVKEQKPYMVER